MNNIDKLRERDRRIEELEHALDGQREISNTLRNRADNRQAEINALETQLAEAKAQATKRIDYIDALESDLKGYVERLAAAEEWARKFAEQRDAAEIERDANGANIAIILRALGVETVDDAVRAIGDFKAELAAAEAEAQREKQRAERFEQALMEETDNLILATRRAVSAEAEAQRVRSVVKDWWELGPERFERKYAVVANLSRNADEFAEMANAGGRIANAVAAALAPAEAPSEGGARE